jgi:predicted nuclease with RNAse H fold
MTSMSRDRFATFLGVDLGGGKGKTTAVARIVAEQGHARVVEVASRVPGRNGSSPPFYDHLLVRYLLDHSGGAVLGIDAPLTATTCVRCQLPRCRTLEHCDDPTVAWFRRTVGESRPGDPRTHDGVDGRNGHKPQATPYTQRACEVVLHREHGILPRETLGQGMGPLTARALYLKRALEDRFRLNENLLEVYPKATLIRMFGNEARRYKRHPDTWAVRARILERLGEDLRFDVWREGCLQNDHCFDAVICAYTAYRWAREGWQLPARDRDLFERDGWIWIPPIR